MSDFEVHWEEYEAARIGGKNGRWVGKSEAFESADEALDFMQDLREDSARKVGIARMSRTPAKAET